MNTKQTKVLFKEEQKFKTPWIFLVIFPAMGAFIFLMKLYADDGGLKNQVDNDEVVGFIVLGIILFVMMIGLTFLFYKMRLITLVNSNGIYFKYLPFMKKDRFISKAEIKSYEIRRYNPRKEYRGHGIKRGRKFRSSGKAFTVSGRLGLQLYLLNDQILIGTQRKEALLYAMDKMMGNT